MPGQPLMQFGQGLKCRLHVLTGRWAAQVGLSLEPARDFPASAIALLDGLSIQGGDRYRKESKISRLSDPTVNSQQVLVCW
jgi:hypothetical protein